MDVLLLAIVSSVVWCVGVGNSDGNESVVAVCVISGKDIIGVPVVVASAKELEVESSIVVDEGSTDERLGETAEEEDSTVDDARVVVSVDRSVAVDVVDDVVAGSSGSKEVVVIVENPSVEVSVEVPVELSVEVSVEVSIDVDVADVGAG
ncbi:hypothetical protein GCG54_00007183 [Colletotrichum gloeosporioides]|uniref:Secreted protein n=1 Tax=Colletotrichum gloeosporioides TaxID=474922 RepID=A0A8H4FM28_COLGL|nr:uncharacterized protein GCG54_00007183 [Colletotrichum gloeosporioides]KAF3806931.1 hypothetical protein GCG54_00007183 [Colletotrichum gloeosporioides]